MKQILQQFTLRASLLVMLLVGAVSGAWGETTTGTITFDFEAETAHRTSGNNSYTSSNNYAQNGAAIALTYADAVTTGSPINGTASVLGRIAKNTTNTPTVLIGPISISDYTKVTGFSYKVKGGVNNVISAQASYSTDNKNWTNLSSATLIPNSVDTRAFENKSITGDNLYFKIVFSAASTSTSNRDAYFDDLTITYEYDDAGQTVTATSTTIDASGITNTDVYTGTEAGQLTATVSANGTAISSAVVTWESSNEDVATIDESGYVTLVAAGTTAITATYAGVDGQYEESSASYTLAVTDSTPFEGGDVTFTCGIESSEDLSITKNGITMSTTSGTWSRTDNYRVYANNSLTISTTSGNITKIQFTISQNNFSGEGYDATTNTWTGNSKSVTLQADGGQVRFTPVIVTVTPEDGLLTPNVNISSTSFNIGETATVTTDGPAVTLSTSDANVASVSGTTVTGVAAGTATITATWAENDEFEGGSKEFTVTVTDPNGPGTENNPYTVAQARAAIDAGTGVTGVYATGIVSEIVTAYSSQFGNISYNISADGTTTADQLQAYRGKSYNGENFTSEDDIKVGDVVVIYGNLTKYGETYEFDAGNQIVSLTREKTDPTISIEDASVAYGSTYNINTELIEGGDITVTSGNTAIATVNGLVITPVAVGSVVITVATAENNLYNAGSKTFTLTVTAPEGKTTAPSASEGKVIFYESFNTNEGTGGNDGSWSGSIASNDITSDIEGWGFTKGNGANQCAKFGSGSAKGSAVTPALSLNSNVIYTLTFKAAAWDGKSEKTEGALIVSCSDENAKLSSTTLTLKKAEWSDFLITITGASNGSTLTFSAAQTSNNRFFLDEVKIEAPATYTIPASGLGTYCSEYPLDLSALPEGVKAYVVESQTDESVTLVEAPSNVKGGTGLVIEGTGGTSVTFSFADSETKPSNLLVGTLAPTYLEANTVYGLKSGKFQPNTAGTIGAHRAYLPNESGNVKSLVIEFKDLVTGITRTRVISDEATIYDLTGRQVSKAEKGIYIVNGKKIAVK